MEGGRRNSGNNHNNNNNHKRERCLTMHQPWASLLVHGIKRIEGRSWPSPLTGRLWIHAAGKVPDDATIKTMEEFYSEIYARDGVTNLKFPQQYPVSKLLGCIEVVGCLRREELARWTEVPEGVSLEALTDFCWLCEHPQKLQVPLEMGGWRGVYDLDSKISDAAIRSLIQVETPFPINFPLPNPRDPFSLKPGSLSPRLLGAEVEKSPKLRAVIDAASQAATQFLNKGQSSNSNSFANRNRGNFPKREDHYIQNNCFNNTNPRDFNKPAATQFMKKEPKMGNNGFDNRNKRDLYPSGSMQIGVTNRNERNFARPAATGYMRKEQNMGNNGFDSRNKRELYTPIHMQFVRKDQRNEMSSLSNNLSRQCRVEDNDCSEKEDKCDGLRSTPNIFAAAVREIRPAP